MTYPDVMKIIQETFDSLSNSGMINEKITVDNNTVILGKNSPLDSITFITFITDLEDRLCNITGTDCYFVIDEIGSFDINNPYLSVEAIANYMVSLTSK